MAKPIVPLTCKCPRCNYPMNTEYEVVRIVSRQGKKKSYFETIELSHTRCGHVFTIKHYGVTDGLTSKKRLYGMSAKDEIFDAGLFVTVDAAKTDTEAVPTVDERIDETDASNNSSVDIDDLVMRGKAHVAYMSRMSPGFERLWPKALDLITHGEYELACMAMRKCLEHIHKDMALANIPIGDVSKRQAVLRSLDAYKFVEGWDTVDRHVAGQARGIGNDAVHYGAHDIIGEDALRMMVLVDTLCMRLYIKSACGTSVEDIVEKSIAATGDIDNASGDDVANNDMYDEEDGLFDEPDEPGVFGSMGENVDSNDSGNQDDIAALNNLIIANNVVSGGNDEIGDGNDEIAGDIISSHGESDVRLAVENAVCDVDVAGTSRKIEELMKSDIARKLARKLEELKSNIVDASSDKDNITVVSEPDNKIDSRVDINSIKFPSACFDSLTYLQGAVLVACVDACVALDKQGILYSDDAFLLGDVFNDVAARLHMDYANVFNDCHAAVFSIFPRTGNGDRVSIGGNFCLSPDYVIAALRHLGKMHRDVFPPRFDMMLVENDIMWRLREGAALGDERPKLSIQRLELEAKLCGCTIASLYGHENK